MANLSDVSDIERENDLNSNSEEDREMEDRLLNEGNFNNLQRNSEGEERNNTGSVKSILRNRSASPGPRNPKPPDAYTHLS